MTQSFPCFLVERSEAKETTRSVVTRSTDDLPEGDVLLRVAYSAINYKDALSAGGHPGVTRRFPHVPGVDATGTVVESRASEFSEGDEVLVTGFDQGQNTWGGFAGYVRAPAGWVVKVPSGLSLREAAIFGTAGLTAAQSVAALEQHGIVPHDGDEGEVVVTGATGGVGSVSVAVLAKIGYRVVAVTGKPDAHDFLRRLGASRIIPREEVDDRSGKPLLAARWAAAVDTVGGNILATVIRSLGEQGCATACGLVAGAELSLTVYPFILRGVKLVGIDSEKCPIETRRVLWHNLAGPWKPDCLDVIGEKQIDLTGLEENLRQTQAGGQRGRVLVTPTMPAEET